MIIDDIGPKFMDEEDKTTIWLDFHIVFSRALFEVHVFRIIGDEDINILCLFWVIEVITYLYVNGQR